MPATYLSKLNLPVGQDGALVELTIKDAEARDLITAIGDALYWIGVTTTELVDNVTTSATITVGSESVTAHVGGMAQYNGEEFVYNGTTWQSVGKNNFGALAFENTAEGSYTPSGSVAITKGDDTTQSITPAGTQGTAPSWTLSGETATFDPGSVTTVGSAVSVVTASGTDTAAFTGTAATITVGPATP